MRFLGYTLANEAELPTEPPPPELYEEMGKFVQEATSAGIVVATGGISPTSEGVIISLKDGDFSVVDGPFAEAKELVAGYTLIQVKSREEAMEWTRRFPNPSVDGGEAELEIRPLYELEDFGDSEGIQRFREMDMQLKKK